MLAWRYLNPRRAMLSAVTIISVTGVLLGVLVLVVVMSVYTGLEKKVKERVLGFTPHIRLEYGAHEPILNWEEQAAALAGTPGMLSVTPFIQDYVLMVDMMSRTRPVMFKALDTNDAEQVKGIEDMLDLVGYPDSKADMGLDDRIVVSSNVARQFQLGVGDKVKFYSGKNFDEVERMNALSKQPPLRELFAVSLDATKDALKSAFEARGEQFFLSDAKYQDVLDPLGEAYNSRRDVRPQELTIIERFAQALQGKEMTTGGYLHDKAGPEAAAKILAELDTTDVKTMNGENAGEMLEIVLPKEAIVIGVYQASQMMVTPDVFMPLPLAQDLTGLEGGVMGLGIRLADPYQAERVAGEILPKLPEHWHLETWMKDLGEISKLLNQQRAMMYFVLSFIMIISAFSMMAVMFTTTIQKRREIGVMKALGAAPGQIVGVFLNQGMILGFVGSLLGVALGLLVIHFRKSLQDGLRTLGFDPFSSAFIGFEGLPAEVDPGEVAIIAVAAFILCSLAALVPAYFASRSDAAKSLRNL
ncbi:ABC transporter permease [Luteolibacter sp. Populi]|uniref:ABC transporter permease n=1 Tax=Luteolibacter sp. Populi TaxID=3230487 RepID=UPI00346578CE